MKTIGGIIGWLNPHKNGFNSNSFFVGNSIFGFFNVSFIYLLLTPFLRTKTSSPVELSTLLTINATLYLIFTYIGGIMFDRFGAKFLFLLSRSIHIIVYLMFFSNNYFVLAFAMCLHGMSQGLLFGKYDSYIYNVCSCYDKLDSYKKFLSGYFLCWDLACFVVASGARFLLQHSGYSVLIVGSIIMQLISILFILVSIPNREKFKEITKTKNAQSIKELFRTIAKCVKEKPVIIYLSIFYGFVQYFSYKFPFIIGDMMLMNIGFTQVQIASYTSHLSLFLTIGAGISLFLIPKKGLPVRTAIFVFILLLSFLSFSTALCDLRLFRFAIFAIAIAFCSMEVSIEKSFEFASNMKIRGSIISVSVSIAGILDIINTQLFGIISKYLSYKVAGIAIVFLYLFLAIICARKIFLLNRKI